MKTRTDVYDTAMTVLLVGVMLAVPFSCLLGKALLSLIERWPRFDTVTLAPGAPTLA
jgi:hypothetical protein